MLFLQIFTGLAALSLQMSAPMLPSQRVLCLINLSHPFLPAVSQVPWVYLMSPGFTYYYPFFFFWNLFFIFKFIYQLTVFLSHQKMSKWEKNTSFLCSLLYPQWLVFSRSLINACWMDEWRNDGLGIQFGLWASVSRIQAQDGGRSDRQGRCNV